MPGYFAIAALGMPERLQQQRKPGVAQSRDRERMTDVSGGPHPATTSIL
jgi:hypothetical protein